MDDIDDRASYSRLPFEFQEAVRIFVETMTTFPGREQQTLNQLKSDITKVVESQLNKTLSETGGTLVEDFNTVGDRISQERYEEIVKGCAQQIGADINPHDDKQALDVLKLVIVGNNP